MADYKDILMGTIKNVAGKVRDFAESDAVRETVYKVRDMAESSGVSDAVAGAVNRVRDMAENSSVRDVYEQGAGRAKVYGAMAKLTLEINGDSTELERVYAEIGRLCYEQNRHAPEGFYAPLFAQAESLESRIAEKQAAVSALRGGSAEADIEVDIVEEDSLFEKAAGTAEEAFESIVEDTGKDGAGLE